MSDVPNVPLAAVAPPSVNEGKTVTVGSTAPLALRIEGPAPDPDDPAQAGKEPDTFHINGNRHESTVGGVALTHGVPAGMLEQWLERHPHFAEFLRVMSPEDVKAHHDTHASYGFEPGLEATIEANKKAEHEPGGELSAPVAPGEPEPPTPSPVV